MNGAVVWKGFIRTQTMQASKCPCHWSLAYIKTSTKSLILNGNYWAVGVSLLEA